jgi:hypothetical protein
MGAGAGLIVSRKTMTGAPPLPTSMVQVVGLAPGEWAGKHGRPLPPEI